MTVTVPRTIYRSHGPSPGPRWSSARQALAGSEAAAAAAAPVCIRRLRPASGYLSVTVAAQWHWHRARAAGPLVRTETFTVTVTTSRPAGYPGPGRAQARHRVRPWTGQPEHLERLLHWQPPSSPDLRLSVPGPMPLRRRCGRAGACRYGRSLSHRD